MELRQLRFFLEIATAGSLSKAAHRLNIAQPALSRRIQALERELDIRLFERHATGMSLTLEGQRLFGHAQEIIDRADNIRDHILDDRQPRSSTVTVGAAPAVGQHFFAPIAERTAEDWPSIKLKFHEGHAYDILAGLETNEVDFVFMIDPEPQTNIEITPLFSVPLYLVGPADDFDFPEAAITLNDLKRFPLAIYPKLTGPRKAIDTAVERTKSFLNVRYETTFQSTIKDFVRRKLAYALMPRSAIRSGEHDFSLARVNGLDLLLTLVTKRAGLRPAPQASVITIAKAEIRKAFAAKRFEGCSLLLAD